MSAISGRRPGIGLWRMVAALVRQRRRLLLATVAVALAVGYLAGALTLLDRVSNGLERLSRAGAERADLIVEGEVAYESALEQTRRLVPSTIAPAVAAVPGVAAVSPRIEDVAIILDEQGDPVVAPGLSEQPLGANWPDDDRMAPYRFVGDGRPPVGADEVVIDEQSAETAGVQVGDQVVVVGKASPGSYEVVGIVDTDEGDLPSGASLALFSTEQARVVLDAQDNDNRVAILLEPDADVAAVEQQIRAVLPAGSELVDGATGAQHRQEGLTRSFTLIRVLIMGFAGLALIVGMVTVANSLTLLYSDRRRTFAALRLVGAKERQLLSAALIEAAGLAAVASLLGAPFGLVLGRVIEGAIGALGTSVPVSGSAVSVSALVAAVVIGTIATVLAAVVPALRACRVPAIDAVAESPSPPPIPLWSRIANALLVGVGAVVLLFGLMSIGDVEPRTAVSLAVAVVVVGGVLALLPTALSLAVAGGIRLAPTRPRTLARIGARDAVRNRARTAATTGALLVATAVVAGLAVFLSSFAGSVDGNVDDLVRSDLVVDSGTFTRGGLPRELLVELEELPEVAGVSGWQVGRVTVLESPLRVTGVDGAALSTVLDPGWVEGSTTELGEQEIALDQATAQRLGAGLGDLVSVTFSSNGVESMQVTGIYTNGSLLLGEAMVDRATLTRQVPKSVDIAALVALTEDTPAARAAVEETAAGFGVTSVLEPSGFVDSRSELLTGFQRVIQWMLLFTLAQALIGVVNTLLLSVGERRREFGLLRATGASRRQLLQLVLVEGVSFALVGTALGLVVGVGGASLAVRALNGFGITEVVVPLGVLAITAAAAMALGIAAAVVPARWAAAVPPLEAVADAGGESRARRRRRRGAAPATPRVVGAPTAAPPPFTQPAHGVQPAPAAAAPVAPTSAAPATAAPATVPVWWQEQTVETADPVSAPSPTAAPQPASEPAATPGTVRQPLFDPVRAASGTAAAAATAADAPPSPSAEEWPLLVARAQAAGVSEPAAARMSEPPASTAVPSTPPVAPTPPSAATAPSAPPPPAAPARPLFQPATPGGSPSAPIADAPPAPPAAPPPPAAPARPLFERVVAEPVAPQPAAPQPAAPQPVPPPPQAPVQPQAPVPPPPHAPVQPPPAPRAPVSPVAEPVAPGSIAPEPPLAEPAQPAASQPAQPFGAEPAEPEPAATAPPRRRRPGEGWVQATPTPTSPRSRAARRGSPFRPAPTDAAGAESAAAARRATERRTAAAAPLDPVVAIRLGAALASLDPATIREATPVLAAFARALEPDEVVQVAVQGWAKGQLTLVARTDRRIVVVLDRFPEAAIESLHRDRTQLAVYGPPGAAHVSLAVVDGRRLLEVTGIRDGAPAHELAGSDETDGQAGTGSPPRGPRQPGRSPSTARPSAGPEYF